MTQPKSLFSNELNYKINQDHRNLLYIANNNVKDIEHEIRILKNGFKNLGFFHSLEIKKSLRRAQDFKEAVLGSNFSNINCTALVVLYNQGHVHDKEINYIDAFYTNRNTDLECKPRIFIFLYEKFSEPETRGAVESDGVNFYTLPVQADLLIIQLIIPNMKLALEEIGTYLKKIKTISYIDDDVIKMAENIDNAQITISTTLTRRLYLQPKETETEEKKKDLHTRRRNCMLKFQISQIQEMDHIDLGQFSNENNLYEIEQKLANDIYVQIPSREDLITKLGNILAESGTDN